MLSHEMIVRIMKLANKLADTACVNFVSSGDEAAADEAAAEQALADYLVSLHVEPPNA